MYKFAPKPKAKPDPELEVPALDIRTLKKELQGTVAVACWTVEQGEHGHGTLVLYDAHGNVFKRIRNKP